MTGEEREMADSPDRTAAAASSVLSSSLAAHIVSRSEARYTRP